ncbi:CoA ester lyase [Pseudorhodoferax sp. Leaf267]|uniref:HpcH/HpaI aldolase/citrate lyase family protein n=1 Tax=Pseudorhodoferax sp. Leaf267 TaxID=1736316 RepID=UPI001F22703F|nr:CoA ester lyase [Pseudorhodoferax sp. Leaf267]
MTTPHALADARSFLFVPGNRPERFEKAAASGADVIVLDLEDAVPAADKAGARAAIAQAWPALQALGVPLVVRVNSLDQPLGQDDLQWFTQLQAPAGVMVPKAESAEALRAVQERLPAVPVLPLIESAAGWSAVPAIAAVPGVLRLVVGHIDFMADTGIVCADDEAELLPLRFAVAMATRLNRLAAAVDGVTVAIQDDARLREDTRRALRLGFGAKLCIHPRQVAVVHETLAPTPQQADWAARVVAADAAAGGAAVQIDGRMVDLPVVLQARRVLARVRTPAA